MSVSAKLEADSRRLRLIEDAINEQLANVRGKLEVLEKTETTLLRLRADIIERD